MKFTIDTKAVSSLAKYAVDIPDAVARAEFRSVNKVAEKTHTRSKREITSIVSLSSSYVSDRMEITKALPGKPLAIITARTFPTKLYTYGVRQLTVSDPKSKGNAALGIAAGRRGSGVAVGVRAKGGKKPIPMAFIMRLQNNNGYGVFTRTNGKLKHHYGPSVDQTFTLVIGNIRDSVEEELEQTYAAQLDYELKGIR